MSQNFIHYIPRRIVTRFPADPSAPWFSEFQDPADGFCRPRYHTSRRSTGPTRAVKPGDTIWLVGQIYSPWGALPAGIDARVVVERIEERSDGALRFEASTDSTWFPLSDATSVLSKLETVDVSGRVRELQSNPNLALGHSLQSMRCLASADALQAWGDVLSAGWPHFISYRICDGTSAAFMKVRDLLHQGEVVFWDRWSLPRRLAERREVVDDKALDAHLIQHLRRSRVVWGIETDKYSATGSYSAKERDESVRMQSYRAVSAT